MLDFSHIPSQYPNADVQAFVGTATANNQRIVWTKPRGKTMGHILLVGNGGNGGNGIVGANSFAGGGGGGGSGGQTSIRFPLWAIPDLLFISLIAGGVAANSSVSIAPDVAIVNNNVLVQAGSGGAGGNGTTVPAGGAAGSAAGTQSGTLMPLGWQWIQQALAGQAGTVGGSTGNSTSTAISTTGLFVTGGTGGGGLPAAAAASSIAGNIVTSSSAIAQANNPAANTSATAPGLPGNPGYFQANGVLFMMAGLGGQSSHGSATGAGLFGGNGGNGAPGCGGGGGGACLTGGVAGVGGLGGPAFCIITCW